MCGAGDQDADQDGPGARILILDSQSPVSDWSSDNVLTGVSWVLYPV